MLLNLISQCIMCVVDICVMYGVTTGFTHFMVISVTLKFHIDGLHCS